MINRKQATNRDQFLSEMQGYLTNSKTRLLRVIMVRFEIERDTIRDDCMDSCDLACEENQRDMRTILSERERLKVRQVDDALVRIASRKYGICELCGLEIAEERLSAMPFARHCCDCQQEQEREAKTRHLYEEHDYMLGSIHVPEEGNYDPLMGAGNESGLELLQNKAQPEGLTASSLLKK